MRHQRVQCPGYEYRKQNYVSEKIGPDGRTIAWVLGLPKPVWFATPVLEEDHNGSFAFVLKMGEGWLNLERKGW
ncbi:MAG: hypothetical protein OIF58_05130 [Cohaesibacter sp.]|nr:hypothetical protein [Cohaesibacter sp.]